MVNATSKTAGTMGSLLLAAGMLGTTTLATAPESHASCISAFGIGNSDRCQSTWSSIAIALGDTAAAVAEGLFSIAIANSIGVDNPKIPTGGCGLTGPGGMDCTQALTAGSTADGAPPVGMFTLAYAAGRGSSAAVFESNAAVALSQGDYAKASVFGGEDGASKPGLFNAAINLFTAGTGVAGGDGAEATVWSGSGNLAANIGGAGGNLAYVNGRRSAAINVGTTGSQSEVGELSLTSDLDTSGSVAFNFRGRNNVVRAKGQRAIAGAVNQDSRQITQDGPGIKIETGENAAADPARATRSVARAAKGTAGTGGVSGSRVAR